LKKDWWKSKACWSGILLMAGGLATAFGEFLAGGLSLSALMDQAVPLFLNGLGVLGIRMGVDWK